MVLDLIKIVMKERIKEEREVSAIRRRNDLNKMEVNK